MEAGAFLRCGFQKKAKTAENILFLYRKDKQAVQQNRYNRQTKGHKRHQRRVRNEKIWMFLLGAAFAAELFLVICVASRGASPRQVMYTFKDDVWDVIYRLNRRWNL